MSRHRGTAKQGGTQALVDLTAAVKQVNKTKKLPRMLEGKNKAGPKGWGSSRRSCISNGCSEEASLRGDLGGKVSAGRLGVSGMFQKQIGGQEEGGTGWQGEGGQETPSQVTEVTGQRRPFEAFLITCASV